MRNLASFVAGYVALWFVVVFLTLVAIGLLREVTILRRSLVQTGFRRESPLVIGSHAPSFSALDGRSGREITSEILHGRSSLLLFISPRCSICRHLVYSSRSFWEGGSFSIFSILAVCKGDEKDSKAFLDILGPEVPLLLDPHAEISEIYGVSGYPVAVCVDPDGRVRGYGHPMDARDLKELVEGTLRVTNGEVNRSQFATN